MAGRKPDTEDGLCRMQALGEEVGGEREGADCVEHHIGLRLIGRGALSCIGRVS